MSHQFDIKNKIANASALEHKLAVWRFKSEKIVFTNGCFDILHTGHIYLLTKAASFGNRLVVGLNADESVKKLNKGTNRPINKENDRALLLAALYCVDLVVLFSEETPLELIKSVKPDVLVKGGDYTVDNIAGAKEVIANNGKVEIVPILEGYSTTLIEQKIR